MTDQGDRLRALAKAAGFPSIAAFARAAGIAEGTARQQANRGSMPLDAARRYIGAARGTGATIEWLLTNEGLGPTPVEEKTISYLPPKLAEAQYKDLEFKLSARQAQGLLDLFRRLQAKLEAAISEEKPLSELIADKRFGATFRTLLGSELEWSRMYPETAAGDRPTKRQLEEFEKHLELLRADIEQLREKIERAETK